MKGLILFLTLFCAFTALVLPATVSAEPQAVCVPWQPPTLTIAHYTFSGAEITLKGIARDGAVEYYWDFGDGSPPMPWTAISDPYNLGVKHI